MHIYICIYVRHADTFACLSMFVYVNYIFFYIHIYIPIALYVSGCSLDLLQVSSGLFRPLLVWKDQLVFY